MQQAMDLLLSNRAQIIWTTLEPIPIWSFDPVREECQPIPTHWHPILQANPSQMSLATACSSKVRDDDMASEPPGLKCWMIWSYFDHIYPDDQWWSMTFPDWYRLMGIWICITFYNPWFLRISPSVNLGSKLTAWVKPWGEMTMPSWNSSLRQCGLDLHGFNNVLTMFEVKIPMDHKWIYVEVSIAMGVPP